MKLALNVTKTLGLRLFCYLIDFFYSPPHLTKIKHETFQKDWRGVYFYNDEGTDEQFAKKGSNLLLDTPENFASWQQIKGRKIGKSKLIVQSESSWIGCFSFNFERKFVCLWREIPI